MRRVEDDGGAIAIVVAVLLIALIGFAAFVIDVGALFVERRELQNGADAGVLAVAFDCAGAAGCQDYEGTAQTYGDGNVINDLNEEVGTNIEEVCGSAGSGLPGCVDPPNVTVGAGYAMVRTRTGNEDAPGVVAPFLQQVVNPDYDGMTVRANSVAAWGSLGGSTDLFPLAFCWDNFNQITNNGNDYGPPAENIYYKTPSVPIECPTSSDVYPGGFGWLDINDSALSIDTATCTATATFDEWEPGRSGVGLPNTTAWNTCVDKLHAKILEFDSNPDAEPLLVPIFDDHQGTGGNGLLRIAGFGAFRPTGYHLGGSQRYPDNMVCGDPQNRCLQGYFMEWVVSNGVIGGGNYGVMTIQLVG